jgi:hypothetical protein
MTEFLHATRLHQIEVNPPAEEPLRRVPMMRWTIEPGTGRLLCSWSMGAKSDPAVCYVAGSLALGGAKP